jgi:hypothetical protein
MKDGRAVGRSLDGLVGRMVHELGRERTGAAESPESADLRVLDRVEEFLARGRLLREWWDRAGSQGALAERFELGRTSDGEGPSFGFFDEVRQGARGLPVMGNFQAMLYDRPKSPGPDRQTAAEWMHRQVREFVLRYFMRVSDFRAPEGFVEPGRENPPALLRPLSWCPREEDGRRGFGFQQLFYKRSGTGEIGAFGAGERFAITDLREIGRTYEWIVLKVRIFDFSFTFQPLGAAAPQIVVPHEEDSYLVLSREFVTDREAPRPGELGRYGLGYAFVKNARSGLLAYGPGEFDAAIELIDWVVAADGGTRVEMVFVANRPERIVNLSFDPLGAGLRMADLFSLGMTSRLLGPFRRLLPRFEIDPVYALVDLANLASAGYAARELCIARETLEKDFLLKHYLQHHQSIAGSLAIWRSVADWTDAGRIPDWVLRGTFQ